MTIKEKGSSSQRGKNLGIKRPQKLHLTVSCFESTTKETECLYILILFLDSAINSSQDVP